MELLSIDDAAKMLRRTPVAVKMLTARRLIPFRKAAGRIIFLREELETWLRDSPGVRPADLSPASKGQGGDA